MGPLRTHLDFETRSLADLPKVGEHAYAQHESTAPLMLAFHTTGMFDVDLIDFFGDTMYPKFRYPKCPKPVLDAIERGDIFVAHNARFEQAIWYWVCHRKWGWPMPKRWSCTAARARYWGLRASLDGAASDLEILHQKDAFGKHFINMFCKPREYKGAKALGIIKTMWLEPYDITPQQARVKGMLTEVVVPTEVYAKGRDYCKSDVRAEMGVDKILPDLPDFEQRLWDLDFKMNRRGLPIDTQSVERAIKFSDHYTVKSFERFDEITGLRPTQRDKVLAYLEQREEIETLGDLKSKTLKRITLSELPADLRDVIQIRLETSKASVKKLEAMVRCTDSDGRARGLFLYGGAHTMRWSGKRLQPQNFTRPEMAVLEAMFQYLSGDFWNAGLVGHNGGPPLDEMPSQPAWVWEAGLRFARPLGALAQAMRGFIAAPKGQKFVVGDYAQIEARVLAWLARCMWLLEAFRRKDDPYVRFGAEHMYHREYEDCFYYVDGKRKVKPDFARPRQISKSAVLGAGFGLGKDKFVQYCDNSDIIISLEEAEQTIKAYRKAHPEIADYDHGLWARVERAAILAAGHEGEKVGLSGTGITFHVHRLDSERYWLICTLPSGRHISYYRPKVRLGAKWGRPCEILSFRKEWNGKSYREDTYGGKLVENIVQGTARDVMGVGALNAEDAGFEVIGLVHDEIISLVDEDFGGVKAHLTLCQHMCTLPPWITDLPVEAEGGTMLRYGK